MRHSGSSGKGILERDILSLVNPIKAISPECPVAEVAELFLSSEYEKVLSLPVVENGRPVGVISRYRFMDMYLKQLCPRAFRQTSDTRLHQ